MARLSVVMSGAPPPTPSSLTPLGGTRQESQAIDRIHRTGRDKPVFVHGMVTPATIDEMMLEQQRRKDVLAEGLFDPEAGGALDITADDTEMPLAGV